MRPRFTLLMLSLWVIACSETFELNAPDKDIWVVYGVLNPGDSVQYVRVSKTFQVEGSAPEYAAQHDLTAKGLQLSLHGNGQVYLATQVDSVERTPPDGQFFRYMTLYRFSTPRDRRLVAGVAYQLSIQSETDTALSLQATTRIPPEPTLVYPSLSGAGTTQCLIPISFEDSARILFRRQSTFSAGQASAYQLSVEVSYRENGIARTYRYGPTSPFRSNQNCSSTGSGTLCYLFENGGVLSALMQKMRDPQTAYTYQSLPICGVPASLSHAVEIEVVAIDTILHRYMTANDPGYFNINTIRREYTNISGSAEAVGIFGSVATDRVPVALTPCAQHLLRLNGYVDPEACQ